MKLLNLKMILDKLVEPSLEYPTIKPEESSSKDSTFEFTKLLPENQAIMFEILVNIENKKEELSICETSISSNLSKVIKDIKELKCFNSSKNLGTALVSLINSIEKLEDNINLFKKRINKKHIKNIEEYKRFICVFFYHLLSISPYFILCINDVLYYYSVSEEDLQAIYEEDNITHNIYASQFYQLSVLIKESIKNIRDFFENKYIQEEEGTFKDDEFFETVNVQLKFFKNPTKQVRHHKTTTKYDITLKLNLNSIAQLMFRYVAISYMSDSKIKKCKARQCNKYIIAFANKQYCSKKCKDSNTTYNPANKKDELQEKFTKEINCAQQAFRDTKRKFKSDEQFEEIEKNINKNRNIFDNKCTEIKKYVKNNKDNKTYEKKTEKYLNYIEEVKETVHKARTKQQVLKLNIRYL